MPVESLNQNDIKPRSEQQRILNESQQAVGTLAENTWDAKLTPEEKNQAKEIKTELNGNNIVRINEILRNPKLRKLLSPTELKQAFQKLRSIHMDEAKQHIDTANVGAVRNDVTNRLDTVSQWYHEIFKNLQGHIESTGPIHEESGENLVDLQNEVTQAEKAIQQLLRQINTLWNTPIPIGWAQDMPPETRNTDTPNNY